MSGDRRGVAVLDLAAAISLGGTGAILSQESDDLDVNLVRLAPGASIAPHVNREVDVLLVAIAGEGVVTVDGETFPLTAGKAIVVPKNRERAVGSVAADHVVYLTVHRRRGGLMPTRR